MVQHEFFCLSEVLACLRLVLQLTEHKLLTGLTIAVHQIKYFALSVNHELDAIFGKACLDGLIREAE